MEEEKDEKLKIHFDEDEGVIRMWAEGEMNESNTKEAINQMQTLIQEHPDAGVLIDASDMSSANAASRELWGDFLKEQKQSTAMYGANRIIRVATRLVFGAIGRSEDVRVFETEEEALEWLNEK